jgi:cytochrome c biogenesis protein CcdA
MLYEYEFLISLAFTSFIEVLTLYVLIRCFCKDESAKISNSLLFFTGFLSSFATLPYLWFIIPLFIKTRSQYILFGESFVILLESLIIFFLLRVNLKKSFSISLICNILSFLMGLILLNN